MKADLQRPGRLVGLYERGPPTALRPIRVQNWFGQVMIGEQSSEAASVAKPSC